MHTGYYPKGGVSVFNLEEDPRFFFPCPFHCLHFYVKRETLQALADEAGTSRIDKLAWPHGAVDETVSHLGSALLPALNNPEKSGALFLDHVVLALNMHFAYAYGGMRSSSRIARGGLAPWRERRSKEMMDGRIGERVDNRRLTEFLRDAYLICTDYVDIAIASILENLVDNAEKRTWFLTETIRLT